MSSSWIAWINTVFYLGQLVVNYLYAQTQGPVASRHDTLITPAPYAFAIWGVIYFFVTLTVLTDISSSSLSIYSQATNATFLRICFTFTCVLNGSWMIVFGKGYINIGTILLLGLWIGLLFIYVFLAIARQNTSAFNWGTFFLSELGLLMYFSWISCATMISLVMSIQDYYKTPYLTLSSYLTCLSILVVLALTGILYGLDFVIGFVAIWAFIGIAQKETSVPTTFLMTKANIQASAVLSASVIAGMMLIAFAHYLIGFNASLM
jgi:hypothetical protein